MQKSFEFKEDVSGLFLTAIGAVLIVIFTLGIGAPWAVCMFERWKAKNTLIDGRKIKFVGEGSALLGKYILWAFFTIITFGIYYYWMINKLQKFKVENTVFED